MLSYFLFKRLKHAGTQVHAATLSQSALAALASEWQLGNEVVVKVQHQTMQGLMESDIRNLRRLCKFVKDTLPYDPSPVSACSSCLLYKLKGTPLVAQPF